MGLIKAATSAINSTLQDQWRDVIRCEDLGNDILMVKKSTPSGIITNKSTIIVKPGQCAVIYDNGKILDATAEEGLYTFDTVSSPSFFSGQFGGVFKEMWQRFIYNGVIAKEQAVYYFNITEIIKNKFGTPAPIPFQDWSHPIPNQMTGGLTPLGVLVRCFGTYTFKIVNPALFMSVLAGTKDVYKVSDVTEQIRSEVIASFQNVLNELGNSVYKVPVLELPSQTDEIKTLMNEKVFDESIRNRGLQIEVFAVESVTLDPKSEKKINEYEHNSNLMMQQGRVLDVMEKTAGNSNGAANGFMGLGMMNIMSGGMGNSVIQNAFNNQAQQTVQQTEQQCRQQQESTNIDSIGNLNDSWICPSCGNTATKNFCGECGTKKPEERVCPNCGAKLGEKVKFCGECGIKLSKKL